MPMQEYSSVNKKRKNKKPVTIEPDVNAPDHDLKYCDEATGADKDNFPVNHYHW